VRQSRGGPRRRWVRGGRPATPCLRPPSAGQTARAVTMRAPGRGRATAWRFRSDGTGDGRAYGRKDRRVSIDGNFANPASRLGRDRHRREGGGGAHHVRADGVGAWNGSCARSGC
jgi:hypothetical protein